MNTIFARKFLVFVAVGILLAWQSAQRLAAQDEEYPDVAAPAADGSSSDLISAEKQVAAEQPADEPDDAKPTALRETATVEAAPSGPVAAAIEPPEESQESARAPILLPSERPVTIEVASFKGIQPGRSSSDELIEEWGAPKEIRKADGVRIQIYVIQPFSRVTVSLVNDVVKSIVVNMEKSCEPAELMQDLDLEKVSSVQVMDDKGLLLGEAFPERGVLFGFAADAQGQVSQVVLEPLDPQPFLLRAEMELHTHYAHCLADANYALKLDPHLAQAESLRSRVFALAGDLGGAIKAAENAVELEPDEPDWRLTLARVLLQTCDFDRAKQQVQQVLDNPEADGVAKAQAHCLLGDCLALAGTGEDQTAMAHHMQAIKVAEPLKADNRVLVRRAAKEVLLDAHLAVAHDIAWGRWQQKTKAVTKWLDRAGKFAQDLVDHEQGDIELKLRVETQALACLAGIAEPPDPAARIQGLLELGPALIKKSADNARTTQLEWQLGLALCDAVAIEQARGHTDEASKFGQLASKHLTLGNAAGRQSPTHDFQVGRLYYRLGALQAIGDKDHQAALKWYDPAVKLLETPVPPTQLADPGRHGEIFVSMAVSYWELGNREEALRLTRQGAKLMERAVEDGQLNKTALAVPYGNMSNMHTELGDKELAKEFAELASKCEPTKR